MSALGVIALVTWLVVGLPVGIFFAAEEGENQDEVDLGLAVLVGWLLAPLIVAVTLVAGACWLLGHAVGRVERAHPTREALERRIRELEDETGMRS